MDTVWNIVNTGHMLESPVFNRKARQAVKHESHYDIRLEGTDFISQGSLEAHPSKQAPEAAPRAWVGIGHDPHPRGRRRREYPSWRRLEDRCFITRLRQALGGLPGGGIIEQVIVGHHQGLFVVRRFGLHFNFLSKYLHPFLESVTKGLFTTEFTEDTEYVF
jgi:hypothetical protein